MSTDSNTQNDTVSEKTKDDKIQELEAMNNELSNNWKRALADYKNLEKRNVEERDAYVSYANIHLLLRILPFLDNLEMLAAHIDDTGLKLIIKDFKQTLKEEGVTEIEVLNKDYDSETMEAIEMIEGMPNKVMEVVSKGYTLREKLLRPARVKVGKLENGNNN